MTRHTVVFVGPAIVALVIVAWGGIRVWQSASVGADTQPGLAIVLGATLGLCLWVWYRARPGASDAPPRATIDAVLVGFAPVGALLMAAMLPGTLPRVFWPAAEATHLAGSIASMTLMTGIIVMQVRRIVVKIRRRSLHRGAGPA